jgi:hypothetical protein
MELILVIFILSILGGGVFISGQYDNHNTVKRALHIGKAHKQAAIEAKNPESEQISQAQLKKLFDDALKAQREEQKLLEEQWTNEFLELLPDTDPQKNVHNMRKAGINVIEATPLVPDQFIKPEIPFTGEQLTYCDRLVTKDTAYVREYPTDDCDFVATFQKGATIRIYGWMRGRYVGKTDVWYQVKTNTFDGWVWSGSLHSQSINGLSRLEFAAHQKPQIRSAIEQEAYKRAKRAAHKAMWQ